MKSNSTNLKFEYIYRDAGNYKQFGSIILTNPSGITPADATELIRTKLIDGEFFDAAKVAVPDVHSFPFNPDLDHGWYEFDGFSETAESPTALFEFDDFIKQFG